MRVLVTGADGFLGRRLIQMLAPAWDVVALVGRASTLPQGVRAISADLTDPATLRQLPESVDAVVHLAQSLQYRSFPDGMRDMMAVNVQGTFELLEYSRLSGCRHFIYASTGSVYDAHGIQGETGSVNPQSAYAVSKYSAELLLRPYSDPFNTLALRLFFLYGPGQAGMLMPNLIHRLRTGDPVSLHGKGDGMVFCPTHVDDVAMVFCTALTEQATGVVNVATPETLTMRDAARVLAEALQVEPKFTRNTDAEVPVFQPTLNRLAEWYNLKMGFRSFKEGISAMLSN